MNRYWTDEENEHLKALVAQGVSIFRVAAKFNRTVAGVRAHAKKRDTIPYRAGASQETGRYSLQSLTRCAVAFLRHCYTFLIAE
jgi:hypothetical protein